MLNINTMVPSLANEIDSFSYASDSVRSWVKDNCIKGLISPLGLSKGTLNKTLKLQGYKDNCIIITELIVRNMNSH